MDDLLKELSTFVCPQGHGKPLERLTFDERVEKDKDYEEGFICELCEEQVIEEDNFHCDGDCDFDICLNCMDQFINTPVDDNGDHFVWLTQDELKEHDLVEDAQLYNMYHKYCLLRIDNNDDNGTLISTLKLGYPYKTFTITEMLETLQDILQKGELFLSTNNEYNYDNKTVKYAYYFIDSCMKHLKLLHRHHTLGIINTFCQNNLSKWIDKCINIYKSFDDNKDEELKSDNDKLDLLSGVSCIVYLINELIEDMELLSPLSEIINKLLIYYLTNEYPVTHDTWHYINSITKYGASNCLREHKYKDIGDDAYDEDGAIIHKDDVITENKYNTKLKKICGDIMEKISIPLISFFDSDNVWKHNNWNIMDSIMNDLMKNQKILRQDNEQVLGNYTFHDKDSPDFIDEELFYDVTNKLKLNDVPFDDYSEDCYIYFYISIAKKINPYFQNVISEFVAETNGNHMSAPIKTIERCKFKTETDYQMEDNVQQPTCAHLLDMVRCIIYYNNLYELINAIKVLIKNNNFKMCRVKNLFNPSINVDFNYRCLFFNVLYKVKHSNGIQYSMICEIQMTLKKVLDIRGGMHKFYKIYRACDEFGIQQLMDFKEGIGNTTKRDKYDMENLLIASNIEQNDQKEDNINNNLNITLKTASDAWNNICKRKSIINWYCVSIKGKSKIILDKYGNDGLNEMREYLSKLKNDIRFCLLRVETLDKAKSIRTKFIYIRFIGSNVKIIKRAKLTPIMYKIDDQFPVKHIILSSNENCDILTQKYLSDEFLRVCGAHKPDYFIYGPNQKYSV